MSAKVKNSLTGLLVTALPLVIAVGCASNSQKLVQAESAEENSVEPEYTVQPSDESLPELNASPVEEAVAMAISNMDGYIERMETVAANDAEVEVSVVDVSQVGDDSELISETIEAEPEVQSIDEMTDEELLVAEVLGGTVDVITQTYESDGKTIFPPPRQMVFHFASGKNDLDVSDHEMIKAHAEYLLQNPSYTLVVTGHADNQGSKVYNQRLSEIRAQNVANLLLAEGVLESQLRVGGMGDSVPMISPKNWDENRRVEFVYQDSMMATK